MADHKRPVDSVLLIGFGGPTRSEDVMPFLRRVVEGKDVPEERLREVEQHYQHVGGCSPYNELTGRQKAALERWLQEHGRTLPVYVGMRNWHPLLAETIRAMQDDGHRHAVGIILAAHRSPVSWERYMRDVQEAIAGTGSDAPAVTFMEPYFAAPRFLEANAARLEQLDVCVDGVWPEDLPLVFTAHSIPKTMADKCAYVDDLMASCRGIADVLQITDWELAYQSRSGDPRTPWLEPDICDVVRRMGADGIAEVVLHAVGFLCDHVEVLYDLDVEAKEVARKHGVRLRRAGCVNDHPEFIALLGERIVETASRCA